MTWFDKKCNTLRRKLRNISNQKHRDPENLSLCYGGTIQKYNKKKEQTARQKPAQCN
jgi:hypothetical protein